MTKAFRLSFMFLIIFSSSLFAVEVDVEEIRTRRVEFINYRGPQGRADSIKAINAIGEGLAAGARKAESNRIIRYHEKYSIVRAISESEPEKYSADIISIDRKAMVTHIANVRRITAAYLRDMYGYSESEAAALALFVSYYNAIHRGDMPYFRSKYKDVVLKRINAGNAGIARIYSQWPGKTRLIIPLTEQSKRGEIGRIDPFVIGDEKTRQMVRKERNTIDERKEMSGLKEKKISDDRKEIEERKREQAKTGEIIKTEEKKIEKEKEDLDKKRRDLEKKEEQTAREKEEIKKIPDPEKRRQKEREAEERKKQVETEKEKIRNEEDAVKKREETVTKKKEELTGEKNKTEEDEKRVAEQEKDLRKEKDEIKKDETAEEIKKDPQKAAEKLVEKEKELDQKKDELDRRENELREKAMDRSIFSGKFYYLKIKEYLQDGHYNNEMVMIDPVSRKVIFKSPIDNICGQRYDIFSQGIVVITHMGNHRSGHRLTILDRETLKPLLYGTDDIFWRSFIEIREGFIYAITIESGRYFLGKYDQNLKIVARSNEWVNENTFITFFDEFVYINRQDRQIMVLKKEDLSLVDVIKP